MYEAYIWLIHLHQCIINLPFNNSCVNFLKNGTNRKNARTHTHTHTFSLWYDILTHIIYIYIYGTRIILHFQNLLYYKRGVIFFLRVHYNYYYDTPKLFNCTPLIFHNQVYLIDYYHLAKQLVELETYIFRKFWFFKSILFLQCFISFYIFYTWRVEWAFS